MSAQSQPQLDRSIYPHPETPIDIIMDDGRRATRVYHPSVGLSLRQYAAIHLRVPTSGIPELDEMIRQARRQEIVGRALVGLLATGIWTVGECATNAEAAADAAMMEEKP